MNIAIIMLAHKNEEQTRRLINHLKVSFDIYVHIDKKSKMNIENSDNVFIYKKYKVVHGGLSIIDSTIFLLKKAYEKSYDRYIFISAQDIPLKSNDYILNFFASPINKDKEFVQYEEVDSSNALHKEMSKRMNNYNFGHSYRQLIHISIRTFLSNLPFLKRTLPKNIYFGSQWFNITSNAIKYILTFIENNQDYYHRFKYTWGGDEVFFNTILMRSEFKYNCVNDFLRYMVWHEGVPKTLLLKDYEELKSSKALFARKFDSKRDINIIDKIYEDLING